MAFPTTSTIDNFNRADGGLGSNWTSNPENNGAGAFAISSNAVRGSGAGGFTYDAVYWNVANASDVSEVGLDLTTAWSGYFEMYLHLRLRQESSSSSTVDGYRIFFTTNYLEYRRIDNGVNTVLGAGETPTTPVVGDSFGFEASGSTLQAYRKNSGSWATMGTSRSDATYAAPGHIGFGQYEDTRTAVLDNAFGGTFSSTAHNFTTLGVGS